MVPLIIIGAESTPRPPATFNSGVGWVGSGKSQLRPRYWAFELLIRFCGLYPVLNASPFAKAQLAWSCVNGVEARAAGELGDALAGLNRTEAPIEEMKKRRLIENALIDVLVIFQTFDK